MNSWRSAEPEFRDHDFRAGYSRGIDGDGVVDLADFATFAQCYNGPAATTPPPGCTSEEFAASDLDADGDVDLGDFATFSLNFTG